MGSNPQGEGGGRDGAYPNPGHYAGPATSYHQPAPLHYQSSSSTASSGEGGNAYPLSYYKYPHQTGSFDSAAPEYGFNPPAPPQLSNSRSDPTSSNSNMSFDGLSTLHAPSTMLTTLVPEPMVLADGTTAPHEGPVVMPFFRDQSLSDLMDMLGEDSLILPPEETES